MKKMDRKAVNSANTRQIKQMEARMKAAAPLLMKGWTLREIREEVMRVMGLRSYSLATVSRDVKRLMEEWKEERVEAIDLLKASELRRLDARDRELWRQWEVSKEEGPGNVAYLRELRENAIERCKLIGLYAPERKELSGEISMVDALVSSGVITKEDLEREKKEMEEE